MSTGSLLTRRAQAKGWITQLPSNHLLRNSFYILATSVATAGFGFAFWLLNARLFTPAQVGFATTLVSASSLICYLSLLGFESTFVRFLPTSMDRDAEIDTGLLLVCSAALALSAAYALGASHLVPALRSLATSPLQGIAFVAFTAFAAVNLATDSVFIACRSAKYNLVVDGFIQGGTKLALPLLVTGLGAFGIFTAFGLGAVMAVAASIAILVLRLHYHPRIRVSRGAVRRVLRFTKFAYLCSLLNIAPNLALPLIVINGRGSAEAGFYYVAFQIAALVYAGCYAVTESAFAEGSHPDVHLGHLARRALRVLACIVVPGMAVLAGVGGYLLDAFGAVYRLHAGTTLAVLGLATPGVALNNFSSMLLKVRKQFALLVATNVTYVVAVCGLALAWVQRGLAWVALAWLLSQTLAGCMASAALLSRRRPGSAAAVPS